MNPKKLPPSTLSKSQFTILLAAIEMRIQVIVSQILKVREAAERGSISFIKNDLNVVLKKKPYNKIENKIETIQTMTGAILSTAGFDLL